MGLGKTERGKKLLIERREGEKKKQAIGGALSWAGEKERLKKGIESGGGPTREKMGEGQMTKKTQKV